MDILLLFAVFTIGLLLSIVVIVWDRHHEARPERNQTKWLASFYERESPRVRK